MTAYGKHDPLAVMTWQRILKAWRSEVGSDIELFGDGLFTSVKLHDPKNPTGRASAVAWWPAAELKSLTEYGQRLLDETPGSPGLVEPSYLDPMGPRHTVKYLWRHRQSVDEVAAILCCASLFLTLFSRSKNDPDGRRAPFDVELQAYRAAASQWREPVPGLPWHTSSSSALPDLDHDFGQVLDLEALATDLAREHQALLRTWRPVVITYVAAW